MGSQRVTKFSDAKRKRIEGAIRAYRYYYDEGFDTGEMAALAGAAVVHRMERTSSMTQALASQSLAKANQLLLAIGEQLKATRSPKKIEAILAHYGVREGQARPVPTLAAGATTSLEEDLLAAQERTDPANAAKDAITQTILDIVARTTEKPAAEAAPDEVVKAFKKVPQEDVQEIFYENALTSLIAQGLDAARGEVPPEVVAELRGEIREKFAPVLIDTFAEPARRARRKPGAVAPLQGRFEQKTRRAKAYRQLDLAIDRAEQQLNQAVERAKAMKKGAAEPELRKIQPIVDDIHVMRSGRRKTKTSKTTKKATGTAKRKPKKSTRRRPKDK